MRISVLLFLVVFCSRISNAYSQCIVVDNATPYVETFETTNGNWVPGGNLPDWQWGQPAKAIINAAAQGQKCWITGGLNGTTYNAGQRSFLVSPCFNFTSLTDPYIEFSIYWEQEFRYDGAAFQYSTDNGLSWTNVGAVNEPVNCLNSNWYNYSTILNLTNLGTSREGWSGTVKPSSGSCSGGNGSGQWLKATHSLSFLAGVPNVRFRFTFGSGTTCNTYDGFAIDNISISSAPPPGLDFTYTCINNKLVSFNKTGSCFTGYLWNFDDPASGAANTSTLPNATHIFSSPGKYNVALTATGSTGPAITVVKSIFIMEVNALMVQPVTCNNGNNAAINTVLTADAGINGIQYSWNTTPVSNNTSLSGIGPGTYIVQVTALNACATSDTVVIINPQPLTAQRTITNASCGNANGVISLALQGGYQPYTFIWSPMVSAGSVATNLLPGNYNIKYSDSAGCSDSVSIALINIGGVNVSVSNTTHVKCFGGNDGSATVSVTGAGGPYTFQWLPNGGNGATANNLTAGTYKVIVSDGTCYDSVTVQINQPASSLAVNVNIYNATCGLSNGAIKANVTGGTLPYTYVWSVLGFTTDSLYGLSSGNYTLTVTDVNGCTVSQLISITAVSFPQITSITSTNVLCFGQQTGSVQATVTGGVAPYSYAWSGASGNFTGNPVNNLSAGTYQLTLTDATGCTAVKSVIVQQPSQPISITSSINNISCTNVTGSANAIVNGGTAPYSYNWFPYGGTSSSANNLSVGNYKVIITDINNCKDSVSIVIVNNSTVKVSIAYLKPVTCFGLNNGAAQAVATGAPPFTFLWSPSGGTNAINNSLGIGSYQVKVTDNTGCMGIDSVNITGPQKIIASVTTVATTCNYTNGSATVVATGGIAPYTYSWTPGGYTGSTISNVAAGRYLVTVTDAAGCSIVQPVIIDQSSAPIINFNVAHTTCNNNNGSITALVSGGVAPYNYLWSPMGAITQSVQNLSAGNYSLLVTDSKGCTISSIVFVNPSSSPVINNFQVKNSPCYGQSGGSVAATITDGIPPYNYKWFNGVDTFTTPVLQNIMAGNYTLTISDNAGCTTTRDTIVGQSAAIDIIVITKGTMCGLQNGIAWLSVTGGTAPYQYKWSVGSSSDTVKGLSSGAVSVTVKDALGCVQNSGIEPVGISYPLKISLGNDTIICPGNKVVLTPGKFNSYTWQDNSTDSVFIATQTGTYKVAVINADGCKASASIKIEASCNDLVFPDAFTPNSDGRNDNFGPLGTLSAVSEYSLRVFNRLGQLVFVSTNPYKKWNGNTNGVSSDNGVYVWVAQYSFDRRPLKTQKGTIMMIR